MNLDSFPVLTNFSSVSCGDMNKCDRLIILNVSTLKSIQLGKAMNCFKKNHALIQYSFNVQNIPMDSSATDLEIFRYSFKFHIAKYYL